MSSRNPRSLSSRLFRILTLAGVVTAVLLGRSALTAAPLATSAQNQIESLLAEKASRTPAQQKMDSQLIYFSKMNKAQAITAAVPTLEVSVDVDNNNQVLVDISGKVTDGLLAAIVQAGGSVKSAFPEFNSVRARVSIDGVESLAARGDVRFIAPAAEADFNTGAVLSEADRTHRADTARTTFSTIGGSGIKIGVISNGVDTLNTSIASGELNADSSVIVGQASTGNEGTAMMELVQDLVPNAKLYFATANGGTAQMAANILALRNAGCQIIVDDVNYFNESPFQDQVISQAVTTISTAGALYFSCARNSGNLNDSTSGTWEGDFLDGGAATIGAKAGSVHNFGTAMAPNVANVVTGGTSGRADLFWTDADAASANDYDLFILSAADAVVRSSTTTQNGTQSPYEAVTPLNIGEKVVIVKTTAAAARFIHLDTGRRILTASTAGNVRGHNAAGAANAFSVAATDIHNSPTPQVFVGGATNPIETFSSDGPRRIFFQPNGTAITPGNFSSTGGQVLQKPDITAADGAATSVTGFTTFYGTSAAAPHAAAIAGLLWSYNSALTPAQIRTLLTSTALDIEGAGVDRDSGAGIIMAHNAIQAAALPDALKISGSFLDAIGGTGGPFTPASRTYTLMNTSGSSINWTASKTQSWITLSSAGGSIAGGASTPLTITVAAAANALGLGTYLDTVTITNTTSAVVQTRGVSITVNPPPPANDNFVNAILLTGGSAVGSATTTYATKEPGEPNHAASNPGGHSVWWKWVAPSSRSVSINTTGSNFDTLLGVYTGSAVNALSLVGNNDDNPGGGLQSLVNFFAVGGTTYYIAVDGYDGANGSASLNLTSSASAVGDLNGDGKCDILLTNTSTGERAIWLINNTSVSAGASLGIVSTNWAFSALGDLSGDGKSDIFLTNTSTSERGVWLMNGLAISSAATLGVVSNNWFISACGDFNGDGKSDIFLTNTATGERGIWLMNGASITTAASLGILPTAWAVSGTGDFNADGKSDILLHNTTTGERAIWLVNGTSISSGGSLGILANAWAFSGVGDLNGDGKADIFLTNTTTGERGIWLVNGLTISSSATLGVLPTVWSISRMGDFNGDGKIDIFLTNTSTAERGIWLMNGTTIATAASLGVLPIVWQVKN